jgi:hypothetical protein
MTPTRIAAILALAALPGWAPAGEGHEDHHDTGHMHAAPEDHAGDPHGHLAVLGDLRLLHAWTRATGDDTALVFGEIENRGDAPVRLTGAETRIAGRAELVGFRLADGEPGYEPLGALPIAPGTRMVLAPEGLALRLSGLARPLAEGERFPLRIAFADAGVEVTVQVEAANAIRHPHAGHAH